MYFNHFMYFHISLIIHWVYVIHYSYYLSRKYTYSTWTPKFQIISQIYFHIFLSTYRITFRGVYLGNVWLSQKHYWQTVQSSLFWESHSWLAFSAYAKSWQFMQNKVKNWFEEYICKFITQGKVLYVRSSK